MDIVQIRSNFQTAYANLNWREVAETFKKMKWSYWWTTGKYCTMEDLQKTVFEMFDELIKGVENVESFTNGYSYINTGRFEVQIHNNLRVRILFLPDYSESRVDE